MKSKTLLLILCATFLGSATAQAQLTDKVSLHGFGTWGYGQTDGNDYLTGSEGGRYDFVEAGFNINAAVASKLRINTQVTWHPQGEALEVALEYVFGEYRISDFFKIRAGKVKHPFGIFSEVYHVGTLRPFLSLAQGVYGPTGIVAEEYNGVGISGSYFGSTWGLEYDLYGGQVLSENEAPFAEEEHEDEGGHSRAHLDDAIGGRLRFHTPLEGLEVGVSSYTGTFLEADGAPRQTNMGAHGEYTFNQVTLRAEYVRQTVEETLNTDAFYVEASYQINASLQVAGRYDWLNTTLKEEHHEAEVASSYFDHQDIGFGVNYWLDPSFVFKVAVHSVKGNRFALPGLGANLLDEEHGEEEGGGHEDDINLGKTFESQIPGLDNRTFLFQAGLQFSF